MCSPSCQNSTQKKIIHCNRRRPRQRERDLEMMASQGKGLRKHDWVIFNFSVYFERSHPTPPQQKNPKALCQGGGDPRPAILKCSHVPIKKRVGYVWRFLYSWVLLGLGTVSGDPGKFLYSRVLPWGFRTSSSGRPALGVPVLMGSPDVRFAHVVRWPSVRRTHLYGNLPYNVMIPSCTKFAGST